MRGHIHERIICTPVVPTTSNPWFPVYVYSFKELNANDVTRELNFRVWRTDTHGSDSIGAADNEIIGEAITTTKKVEGAITHESEEALSVDIRSAKDAKGKGGGKVVGKCQLRSVKRYVNVTKLLLTAKEVKKSASLLTDENGDMVMRMQFTFGLDAKQLKLLKGSRFHIQIFVVSKESDLEKEQDLYSSSGQLLEEEEEAMYASTRKKLVGSASLNLRL
jgi:hypothetical protein